MMHDGKPLYSHGYPRPFDKAFHGRSFKRHTRPLGLYSYRPAQISSSLIKYIERLHNPDPKLKKMPRRRQVLGLLSWKNLESRGYGGTGSLQNPNTELLLHAYSECFDNLFFGGVLHGFYKIRFVDPSLIPGFDGKCCWRRSFEHGFEIDIILSDRRNNKLFEALDRPSQLRGYLGTLLHEMTHAVFQLYCCHTCTSCNKRYKREVGASGHSMQWQKLAISIEDTINQCPDLIGGGTFTCIGQIRFFWSIAVTRIIKLTSASKTL